MTRPRGPSIKVELPITRELVELLEEVFPVAEGEDPTLIEGWCTPSGNWRKAVAHYPSGWRLRLNFDRQGRISSSSASIGMRISGGARDKKVSA